MSAVRGVVAGVLGLSLLEAAASSSSAANNAGVLFTASAAVIRRLVDPSVPLIPDRRTS